jgi:chromosome segregation ATPase
MSDTPDTDAFITSQDYSPTGHQWRNFTRKLERERDEARDLHRKALSEREATEKEVDAMLERSLKAEREREEARELLAKALVRGDLALSEIKKAKEELFWSDYQDKREMQRERDEAREQIDNIRKMLSESGEAVGNGEHDYSIIDMIENLIKSKDYFVRKSDSVERECDEARKHLKEIEEYGTEEINAAIDLRRNLAQALVDLDDMQYQRDEARELAKEADLGHDMAISDLRKCETELAEATTKLAEISSLTESIVEKANALIARWDQPSWKDTAPTARFINALRIAVRAYERNLK